MSQYISNVSLLFTKHPKRFKLCNPKEIINCEGTKLMLYMVPDGSHGDFYLHAACTDTQDQVYVKVSQKSLLSYLHGKVALQEVLFSCSMSTFYYVSAREKVSITIEMPISMLSNYRIAYSENRLNDLQNGLVTPDLIQIIDYFENLINLDPFEEENWVINNMDIKIISIDASLYLRYQ